jgi:hypothetical protein
MLITGLPASSIRNGRIDLNSIHLITTIAGFLSEDAETGYFILDKERLKSCSYTIFSSWGRVDGF